MKFNLFEDIVKYTPKNKKRLSGNILRNLNMIGSDTPMRSKETNMRLSSTAKGWHILVFGISVFGVLLVFIARLFTLQVIQGEENLTLSNENRVRIFNIQAERGVIYDRNGKVLVRNRPSFSVDMNTNICGELCVLELEILAQYLPLDLVELAKLDYTKEVVVIASNLDKSQVLPVEANLVNMPSLSISTVPQRDYLYKEIFSHVIGYVGLGDTLYPSIVGKDGIESSYDNYLTGFPGNKIVQVNSLGGSIDVISERKSFPGRNITLNIDYKLQAKAAELLKKTVDEGEAEAGVVVAQDPNTGGILAMVSYPYFDPDKISTGISVEEYQKIQFESNSPFFNRAISAAYPPGSVFKMGVLSAALSEGVVTENTRIFDPGFIKIGSFIYRNWKLDGHGYVNAREALQLSNDVYFYTIGGGYKDIRGLGITKLDEWARKFGYGEKTGIDLKGEITGFMPDGTYKEWYLGDTFITSIGQGDVLATPLQVNNATTYFANGGYLFEPKVVMTVDGVGEEEPIIISQSVESRAIYKIVREGMRNVMESGGTAYPFFDFPATHNGTVLAGKTGTSEYIDPWGKERTHAWFTMFGPYENPDIALTVFLEGGGSGSSDAAPIARELADLWFSTSD